MNAIRNRIQFRHSDLAIVLVESHHSTPASCPYQEHNLTTHKGFVCPSCSLTLSVRKTHHPSANLTRRYLSCENPACPHFLKKKSRLYRVTEERIRLSYKQNKTTRKLPK